MTLALHSNSAFDEARSFLREALRAGCNVVTLRGPDVADLASLWPQSGDATYWDAPGEEAVLGMGVTSLDARGGSDRFEPVAWPRTVERRQPGVCAPPPRLYGGFSFAPGSATQAPWSAFGDGFFVRARWEIGSGFIRFNAPEGGTPPMAELETLWRRASQSTVEPDAVDDAVSTQTAAPDFGEWQQQVDAIRSEIAAGRFEKVVTATRASLRFDRPIDARWVLMRLRRRYPGCTTFAFRRAGSTFLGATPEWLLHRRGAELHTEAVAGSAAPREAGTLLESAKDRHEHSLVVDSIVAALTPLAEDITVAPEPSLHALPNVVHLRTPIRARVHDLPTLRLLEALHPTPAVGGVPHRAALDWITEHEPARGWYASPVGWIDGNGDGSFAVALRSGLIEGCDAWAFAGCGIVGASRASTEHEEVCMKLSAFVESLRRPVSVDDAAEARAS